MKRIVFHPDAESEITDAARYYELRQVGLGSGLLGEVEQALAFISTDPEVAPRIGSRLRKKSLWRFPYHLIYAVSPDRIRIVAFAHQKRRPFYWQKRLKGK
jgi:plasmid stabilization system protein ParE